jgi:hypothetical protein
MSHDGDGHGDADDAEHAQRQDLGVMASTRDECAPMHLSTAMRFAALKTR